ncbi:MAG: nucleotidyltransferase family protein [Oscillospiraceae bacterium]|nr:nucleotidyltransferase family protein [Oscillospiraceae bacterium]
MKTAGIICEYNPFHLGHQAQFRRIRETLGEDTALVCLMSGNYVQRGEPALYEKSVRAEAALRGGADLVLELPVTCALRSAEGFADGGVAILDGLSVVDTLSFGCESSEGLWETARLLRSEAFPPLLRRELETGSSFAAARQRALEALGGDGRTVASPNNILGVEYCKSLQRRGSGLEILPILRRGGYHELEPDAASPSATSLRRTEDFSAYVPAETRRCYEGRPQYRREYGERAMLARLRMLGEAEFAAVPYGGEGLWRKVMRACQSGGSVEEILRSAKSKRYAYTRLSRLLLCACLGISQARLDEAPPYVRVLGFRETGRALLRRARDAGSVPLCSAGARCGGEFAALERRCDLLYDLFCEKLPGESEPRRERVCYLKNTEKGLAK